MYQKFLGSKWEASTNAATKSALSAHIVRVEFNFSSLPNNAVHVSGFCGEDGSDVEFSAVSLQDITPGPLGYMVPTLR
jgi:hypothetical protein